MSLPPQAADLSPEARRALLAQLLREQARARLTRLPLSYGQQALYFTQQMAPASAAYNIAFAARVYSPLKLDRLQHAFQAIIDRHAALRTSFVLADDGPQQIIAGAADLNFTQVDAAAWDEAELASQVDAAHQQPFDLACGPLLRVHLFTRSPADHVLLMTVHHIVFDGWSMGLVLDELARLYLSELEARPAGLNPTAHQYDDFVTWQREMLAGPEGVRLRTYWHQQLAGELPLLDLPLDKPRPPLPSMRGDAYNFSLDPALASRLRSLARAEHTTLYAVFLAAFFVLLHRHTGQEDLIIGAPMAGRSHPAFQQTVGYLVSPLPLRATVSPTMPFRSLLAHVTQTLHTALDHEDYPFALLVEQLQPRRTPGRTPLIEVLFTHQKVQILGKLAEDLASGGFNRAELHLEPYPLNQESGQFDLSLLLIEANDNLACSLKYSSDLFEAPTVARMAGHLQSLIAGLLAEPDRPVGELPMLTAAERAQLLVQWNATSAAYPRSACLHDLLSAQAARTPAAIAVTGTGHQLSYTQLETSSNQLAHYLRTLGVRPGVLVGLLLERTPTMLVALLGILKAGGAYVPLDPAFPTERLAMMLADSQAPLLLTQADLAATLAPGPARQLLLDSDWPQIAVMPTEPPAPLAQPTDLAYVIFTSGSTGRPKGVQIPHRAVVNFLQSMAVRPGLTSDAVLAAVTTLSFDIAVLELFLPLSLGARVLLVSRGDATNGEALATLLAQQGVTCMQATPVTWRLLLAADWHPTAPFTALCGGEALPPDLAAALLAQGVTLWNMYGPTETTVWSTLQPISDPSPPILIGRPLANTRLFILTPALQPVPIGVIGTLYIGGDGLARGYLGQTELTAERFIRDPFSADPDARLYNTGDLARYHPDGAVELLGRNDHQVKIRGFRIELGEIELALARHPQVAEAVVVVRDDGRGGQRLVAYLVAAGSEPPAPGALRLFLRNSLPEYMLPAGFITLSALPRTPNGKIDRQALPAPEAGQSRAEAGYRAPASPTEQAIAEVWRTLLQVERVSVYDNFFDLGGHSLLAVEALARLEHQLGVKLGPPEIRMQSLGQLAATYDERLTLSAVPAPVVSSTPAAPPAAPPSGLAGKLFGAVRRVITPGEKK